MLEFFLNRFKDKSESDLIRIVNSKANFQPEAVNAAIQILNEKYNAQVPLPDVTALQDTHTGLSHVRIRKGASDIDKFKRSFSYRDILTASSIAILFSAYLALLKFYSNERVIENAWTWFILIGFVIALILNHIFYKIEHRRGNDYLARYFFDLIFIAFFQIIQFVYGFYPSAASLSLSTMDGVGVFFVFAILVALFEILLSFIKYILRFFRWEIF